MPRALQFVSLHAQFGHVNAINNLPDVVAGEHPHRIRHGFRMSIQPSSDSFRPIDTMAADSFNETG